MGRHPESIKSKYKHMKKLGGLVWTISSC
jgi:hypothetical protein